MDKDKKKVCSFYEWEWSKAADSMRILLNISNLDPLIVANIREINKCIFKIATTDDDVNTETSVQIDESKLNRLTSNEFNTLLDQVGAPETFSKDKDKDKQDEKQDEKQGSVENKEETKKRLGDLFCQSNPWWWWPNIAPYKSGETPGDDIIGNGKYKIMFDGFYSIQTKLIETQLKESLIKFSELGNSINNSNIDTVGDVNYLYSKMLRYRKVCALLPSKHQAAHFESGWPRIKGDIRRQGATGHVEMIEYYDKQKNSVLKTYCLLSCSLYNIWFKEQFYNKSEAFGLDGVLYLNQSNKEKSLVDISLSYLLDQVRYSCIFGKDSFISNPDDLRKLDSDKQSNEAIKQDQHDKTMKKVLFNNDLTNITKFVEYCLQDIPDQKNWVKNYEIDERWDSGIGYYIMNRMLFVIFHDLMCDKYNQEHDALFPQLKEFFMFMYNFCVYIHCYPTEAVRDNELFLVKQYYQLKDTIYNVYNEYSNEIKIPHPKNFNYFDSVGTLLHKATVFRMSSYVLLLLKEGSDINVEMRRHDYSTPLRTAEHFNNYEILSLFSQYKNKDDKNTQEREEEEKTKMNEKSLESRYDELMNQLMAAKYFLINLGCDIQNASGIEGIVHKSLKHTAGDRVDYEKHYSDDFYRPLKDLIGLQKSNNGHLSMVSAQPDMIMRNVVESVISLLSLRMVISQDLLIICAVYCSEFCGKDSQLPKQLFQSLKRVTKECLQSKKLHNSQPSQQSDEKEKEKSGIDLKERNYQWFKYFLLKSTVWLVRDQTVGFQTIEEKEKEKDNESILFDSALQVVNGELVKQKKFIWDNVEQAHKQNSKMFSQLTTFGDKYKNKNGKAIRLRQDGIENGIKSSVTEYDLMISTLEAGLSGRAANLASSGSGSTTFNINFEYTTKVYLTECLQFSHLNNSNFQKQMSQYFNNLDVKCKYAPAPVKLYDRCVVKSTSDYSESNFPQSACILDFLRFSVTFDTIESMVKALNQFINDINDNKITCLKPNGVLRIKNGFKNIIKKWKSYKDAEYCDIKLNIIYCNNKGETMLVEGQFLLKFLLTAKKMGHKLYAIVRQSDFIHNISNEIYKVDGNYEKYQFKINRLIDRTDTTNLMKQLFWRPNIVFSIINKNRREDQGIYKPILFTFNLKFSSNRSYDKFLLFCLHCLLHLSFVLLNEKEHETAENTPFLGNYLNFNNCNNLIIADENFWGINARVIDSHQSIKCKIIETIMKLTCFNGMENMRKDDCQEILSRNIREYNIPYLAIVYKYISKNAKAMGYGVNTVTRVGYPPMTILFNRSSIWPHLLEEMLQLYLNISKASHVKIHFLEIDRAISRCDQSKNKKCISMLQDYQKIRFNV